MRIQRRTNPLWGVVLLALAILMTLRALGVLPDGVADLLVRAWPALLVLFGLSVLLRDRMPLGGLFALIVSVALVGGLAAISFANRATQERADYTENIAQPVGATVSLLRVQVQTLATEVELVRVLAGRTITGQFVGSSESRAKPEYSEAGDSTASFILKETLPNPFPRLEAIGRGRLRLELPADVPLDVQFSGENGNVSLNLSGLALERLNVDLRQGDALVTLPGYKPKASPETAGLGTLAVQNGSISVSVPTTVAAQFTLDRGGSGLQPQFDPNLYNYLVGDVLESRLFDTANIKLRYKLIAPRGQIAVVVAAP
jgi:hypothetical protein